MQDGKNLFFSGRGLPPIRRGSIAITPDVTFVGGGTVAPAFDSLAFKDALPGGGAGLRFTVASRNRVNIRADYAWGKNSSPLYVGVAEAF
jgi:hypothetical protein